MVAKEDQSERFRETWIGNLKRRNLPYFRMSKFVAGQGPYAALSIAERQTLLDQLLLTITTRSALIIGAGILKADYDIAVTDEQKRRYGQPYGLAAQICWVGIRIWAEKHEYKDPIPHVLEQGTEFRGQIITAFNKAFSRPEVRVPNLFHSLTLCDKHQFPELQAADIIAYSMYKVTDHTLAGGAKPSRWVDQVREQLSRVATADAIFEESGLRAWMANLDAYYLQS
jgi:hypothetical protein